MSPPGYGFCVWMQPVVKSSEPESPCAVINALQRATACAAVIIAESAVVGWFMTNPHDGITVGSVTLRYSMLLRGWLSPDGQVIKNPLKAQRVAEELNRKKVTA